MNPKILLRALLVISIALVLIINIEAAPTSTTTTTTTMATTSSKATTTSKPTTTTPRTTASTTKQTTSTSTTPKSKTTVKLTQQQQQAKCQQPLEPGPCHMRLERYYYNSKTNTCEKFQFGGCRGNDNKFGFRQTCEEACVVLSKV